MDLKHRTELEQKAHETLYNNINLLTAIYPTTREFDMVFRKNMFANNNKTAFFEVVHYLLHILDPQQIKEKLTYWPVYDIRQESKFRSELISYLNEINNTYPVADLPLVQSSSIVCPGGSRIVKFMLKLSELVLYEHLVRSHVEILMPPTSSKGMPSAISKSQLDHIKKQTLFIESQVNSILSDFEEYNSESLEKARKISSDLTEVSEDIKNAKAQFEIAQKRFILKYPSYPTEEELKQKLNSLKNQVEEVVSLKNVFLNCEKLIDTLKSSDFNLEHDETNFEVPNEIHHMISDKKTLNLSEYFQALQFLLEKRAFKFPNPNNLFVENIRAKLQGLTSKYEILLNNLILRQLDFENLMEELGVIGGSSSDLAQVL